jgi:hypothetical protein
MSGQGELALTGLPKRLVSATPTRLTTWLDCPRRYRFTHLDRPAPAKGPPWAHNSLGASVHLAPAGFWRLEPARRSAAAAGVLLEKAWLQDGFRHERQRRPGRTGAVWTTTVWQRASPASPSPSCRWCDFVRACPEGSAQYLPTRRALGRAKRPRVSLTVSSG